VRLTLTGVVILHTLAHAQAPDVNSGVNWGNVWDGHISPHISLKKDGGLRCRAENNSAGFIVLTFELSRDEQQSLLTWRRLGMLTHVKAVLESVARTLQIEILNLEFELNERTEKTQKRLDDKKNDLSRLKELVRGCTKEFKGVSSFVSAQDKDDESDRGTIDSAIFTEIEEGSDDDLEADRPASTVVRSAPFFCCSIGVNCHVSFTTPYATTTEEHSYVGKKVPRACTHA
jgi:hypothetical protein